MNWRFWKKSNNGVPPGLFRPLTPTNNAKGIEIYSNALDFALKNKDIRNIAVTGIYGSGKSSFLRTYFSKKHKNVLWVSLASFLDGEIDSDSPDTSKETTEGKKDQVITSNSKDEHLLEVSILQQIFYAAKQSELPFSRLRRTTGISGLRYVLVLIIIGALGVGLVEVLQPAWFNIHLDASFLEGLREQRSVFFWRSIALLASLVCYGVLKMWQFLKKYQLRRIAGKGVEIELWQKGDESILNKHIDEILYFFESTRYKTIVFEDIDRFNKVDIFTKLREINLILNGAKQIDKRRKPIRFIYALREDIFKDRRDKVKFFDFILPIVPIINASNSRDILTDFLVDLYTEDGNKAIGLEKAKEFSDIVQEISPFFSDMRLVKNICNEFAIYKGQVPDCTDAPRLLGMVVFKNFFPKEFALLHSDEGVLVKLINSKAALLEARKTKLMSTIEARKSRILAIRDEEFDDLRKLDLLYLGAFLKVLYPKETNVRNGYDIYTVPEVAHNDNLFKMLKENKILSSHNHQPLEWGKVEKEVDPHHTYNERVELVKDKTSAKIESLEEENENDSKALADLQGWSLSQIATAGLLDEITLKENLADSSSVSASNIRLLFRLIAGGYINEQYKYYISIFHGNKASRTPQDYFFEIDAMQGKEENVDLKLDNPTEVIKNLPLRVFKTKAVLNLSLFKELVEQKGEKYQAVIKLLATEDWDCCGFLSSYLGEEESPLRPRENIYCEIVKQNPQYVEHMLDLYWPDQSPRGILYPIVGFYLKRYLENGEGALNPSVKRFLEEDAKVRKVLGPAGLETPKAFTQLIQKAQLCFSTVDTIKINNEELCMIADKLCAYRLDLYNIERVVGVEHRQALQRANLSTIIDYGSKTLYKYVRDNFESYVDNAYDKLEQQQQERVEYILEVLNRTDLSPDTKKRFLDKQDKGFEVKNVQDIHTRDAVQLVLDGNYLSVSWENIIAAGVILGSAEKVIPFAIVPGICNRLASMKCALPWDKAHDVAKALAESNELADDDLEKLLRQLPQGRIDDYDGTAATSNRIRLLCKAHRLKFSPTLYEHLKSNGEDTEIVLAALRFKELDQALEAGAISVTKEEIDAIIRSSDLSASSRLKAITRFESSIVSDVNLAEIAAKLLTESNYRNAPKSVLEACLQYVSDISLQCFMTVWLGGDISQVRDRLSKFPEPISRLANPGTNILVPTGVPRQFIDFLKDREIISSETSTEDGMRVFAKRS